MVGPDHLVKKLAEAVLWAPSADNTQPWHLSLHGSVLTCFYDTKRVAGETFPPDHPATHLAIGAALENVHQFSESMGIGVEELPTSDEAFFKLRLSLPKHFPEGDLGHDLFSRHTNRLPYRSDPLDGATVDWVLDQRHGGATACVVKSAPEMKRLAALVRLSSEMRFRTQEIHELLGRSLRFSQQEAESGDGLDVSTLHLPPGGRTMLKLISEWPRMSALNRFGAYKLLAAIETKTFLDAAAIITIISDEGRNGALEAGRILERVWIELNGRGVAVHPYFVVADQLFRAAAGALPNELIGPGRRLSEAAMSAFGLGGKRLYILLRVGIPAHKPVRSRRLPLDKIFSSL